MGEGAQSSRGFHSASSQGESEKLITMLHITEPTAAEIFRPRTLIDADGTVEGYASLFGEVDAARDMVMPGAFAQSLRQRDIRRVPMLFQHDPAEPIGIWLELREDFRGLYARGRLIPDVKRAAEVLALLRAGTSDGLSIGFRTVKGRVDPKTRIRKLDAVDLWEISIVTFPLLAGARVRAVSFSSPSPACGGGKGAGVVEERLLRRHPRISFARARAEREWKGISAAGGIPPELLREPPRRRQRTMRI
jgi:HK97 family phage prohead protease